MKKQSILSKIAIYLLTSIYILAFCLTFSNVCAQNISNENDTVYNVVDEPPVFADGFKVLNQFLFEHIAIPPSTVQKELKGKIIARFVVRKRAKSPYKHCARLRFVDGQGSAKKIETDAQLETRLPARKTHFNLVYRSYPI